MTFTSEDEANQFDGFQRFQIFLLFMVACGTGVYALHLTSALSNRLGMAEIVIQSQEQRIAELDRTADTHATPAQGSVQGQ